MRPRGWDKIQPLSVISNNGEMNSLSLLFQFMSNDIEFQAFLGLKDTNPKLWDETQSGKVALSDSYLLSVYLRFLLAQHPGRPLGKSIASLIPNIVNAREFPERYASTLLADVNYVGPLAGVFSWADQVVVGCDPNGFRPLCAAEFKGHEGKKLLQFSSEWLVRKGDAKYSVVHPGQVLELDMKRHVISPVNRLPASNAGIIKHQHQGGWRFERRGDSLQLPKVGQKLLPTPLFWAHAAGCHLCAKVHGRMERRQ